MNSGKLERSKKLKIRRAIADAMTSGIIPWYLNVEGIRRAVLRGKGADYMACMARLVSKGCDLRALSVVLDLGESLRSKQNNSSVPKARVIKALARKMKRLAKEIEVVESSLFMTILNRQEMERWHAETGLSPRDLENLSLTFPFLVVPKWLDKRAAMYEEWLRLASQKIPPKQLGLGRLGRIVLPLYVKYATGQTQFPVVIKLLEYAGFGQLNAAQLSRETKEFEHGYPLVRSALKIQFEMLHPPNLKPGKLVFGGFEKQLLQLEQSHR